MDNGFMAKIRELLMGGGTPEMPPDTTDQARPWDSPALRPAPLQPSPGPSPSPSPVSPMEDAVQQAVKLQKQREVWKNLLPEKVWNTPQQ